MIWLIGLVIFIVTLIGALLAIGIVAITILLTYLLCRGANFSFELTVFIMILATVASSWVVLICLDFTFKYLEIRHRF